MGEVSVIGQLIKSLIGLAIAATVAGTLGDLVFSSHQDAKSAIANGGMSYGAWNRKLLDPNGSNCKGRHRSKEYGCR